MFQPVSSKVSFPQIEEKILALWKENKTFEKYAKDVHNKMESEFSGLEGSK